MALRRVHSSLCTMLLLCVSFYAQLALFATPAMAADDTIQINARNTVLTFPKTIDFQVSAQSTQYALKDAELTIIYKKGYGITQNHTVDAPDNTYNFIFDWEDDLTSNTERNFPVVGTVLQYYWTIEDTAGNKHIDLTQTLEVNDNRYNWQHLEGEFYQVNWYDRSQEFGQMIVDEVSEASKSIHSNLGIELHEKINFWIYSTQEDFRGALPPQTYEWAGGEAFPEQDQTSFPLEDDPGFELQRILPHELSHMILAQNTRSSIIPSWLDEGLAVYNQEYHEPQLSNIFQDALDHRELLRLNSIENGFPEDSDKAELAYAQSWKLVDYMFQTYGQTKINNFIKALNDRNAGFENDMVEALGVDTRHLEDQWRRSLHQPPTLSDAEEQTPVPTPVPTPAPKVEQPIGVDPTSTVLLLLGSVLVVIAVLGAGSVYLYARNSRQKAWQAQQAQYYANAQAMYNRTAASPSQQQTVWSPPAPHVNEENYTDPTAYLPPAWQLPSSGTGQASSLTERPLVEHQANRPSSPAQPQE